jgi:hypothetical protein
MSSTVSWDVTPYIQIKFMKVSEEITATIFRVNKQQELYSPPASCWLFGLA